MNPHVMRWSETFLPLAERHGVPPALVAAVMEQESGGSQYREDGTVLTSPAGARGLMQLMPGTAAGLDVNPDVPAENIDGGVRCLAEQYRRFISWRLAVAAYNAGPNAVDRYLGVPPYEETQRYVASVSSLLLDYLALDVQSFRADDQAGQHAPQTGTWREAYSNVLGVANLLRERIRRFVAENADVG